MTKAAYSIPDFCECHAISRSFFYKLPAHQRPRVTRLGARRIITEEDAAEWRRRRAEESEKLEG